MSIDLVRVETRGAYYLVDDDEKLVARIPKDEHPGTRADWLSVSGRPPNLKWHRFTSWEIKRHSIRYNRHRWSGEALFIYSDVVGGRIVRSPQLVRVAPDAVIVE